MHIAILGRQPELSIAELERVYGHDNVRSFSDISALVESDPIDVNTLGGSQKAGEVVFEGRGTWRDISQKLVRHYLDLWSGRDGKTTLGISAYGFNVSPREVQKTGLVLKSKLKQTNASLRLVPNDDSALSSASAHHNKLGLSDNKVELLVVKGKDGKVVIAESTGAQNITALARRDQGRPKRDAFVGMLPPKLALMIVNLAVGNKNESTTRLLDPFCGTGVILQEAALLGFDVYGTDLADKMIDYSTINIDWLKSSHRLEFNSTIHQGDAVDTIWESPVDVVAAETYLGQPFSAPPSPAKLKEVRSTCNLIITKFLQNIGDQINPGTSLCLAVPAWRGNDGRLTHLPAVNNLESLGYEYHEFKNVRNQDLIYFREDQVVARQLLVIKKA